MRVDVEISQSVRATLEDLAATDRPSLEKLAEILLPFRKTPRPRGSRLLGEPPPEDRIWEIGGWTILYRVEQEGTRVVVGVVSRE